MRGEDLEIAGQIAESLFGCPVTLTRVSGRGSCNRVFVAAAGSGKLVVRMNADRDSREFLKEAWCMEQVKAVDVSVPRPLGHGVVGGWNYGVQSFEGDGNGTDCRDQLSVWYWLGQAAARVHSVAVVGFGNTMLNGQGSRFDGDWRAYIAANLMAVSDRKDCNWLSDGEAESLHCRFEDLAARQFRFGLCHGDLAPRNVVLGAGRMALVDWGCAEAHVIPHFDFRELLRDHGSDSMEVSAFATGYGMDGGRLQATLPEIESVLLLCAFDLVRWAQDRAPMQFTEKKEQFRNYFDRFQPSRSR